MHLRTCFQFFLSIILLLCFFNINKADYPSNVPRIVTGPIIGKVTTTTARILLEFNIAFPITVVLANPYGFVFSSTRETKAFIPVPFFFEKLEPNTTYRLSFDSSNILMVESYFTTLSGEPGKLNFAVISGNDRTIQQGKDPEDDLWTDLLARTKNKEISYLLHIGDQVYVDAASPSAYSLCMSIINQTPRSQRENIKQEVLEILRNEYRRTWNLPTVKEVLAKIPSLTILNEHEVRNSWGYLPEDADLDSSENFYQSMARQVYYEYQRQLREDVDFDYWSFINEEYYYEVLNDIGFFPRLQSSEELA